MRVFVYNWCVCTMGAAVPVVRRRLLASACDYGEPSSCDHLHRHHYLHRHQRATTGRDKAVIRWTTWRGVAWRGVAWRGVAWRGEVVRGVVVRGVVVRGVVMRGVVMRGVVVRSVALPSSS